VEEVVGSENLAGVPAHEDCADSASVNNNFGFVSESNAYS
jgi:hypothetical protein